MLILSRLFWLEEEESRLGHHVAIVPFVLARGRGELGRLHQCHRTLAHHPSCAPQSATFRAVLPCHVGNSPSGPSHTACRHPQTTQ